MQPATIANLAKIIKSIGNPIRLKILCLLADEGLSVSQIHERLATSYANVSQHLQRLQHQGLVVTEKKANFVHYSIAAPGLRELILVLRRLYCAEIGETPPPPAITPK
ncbi:MAG: metalloregulator ArsR/SmtB family transcription factor [Desulfobacteraceae bacterium]|nr:metalloregulator ArsR/SmtB family transcription factor [Desulfobacteraceae bacterium]